MRGPTSGDAWPATAPAGIELALPTADRTSKRDRRYLPPFRLYRAKGPAAKDFLAPQHLDRAQRQQARAQQAQAVELGASLAGDIDRSRPQQDASLGMQPVDRERLYRGFVFASLATDGQEVINCLGPTTGVDADRKLTS